MPKIILIYKALLFVQVEFEWANRSTGNVALFCLGYAFDMFCFVVIFLCDSSMLQLSFMNQSSFYVIFLLGSLGNCFFKQPMAKMMKLVCLGPHFEAGSPLEEDH